MMNSTWQRGRRASVLACAVATGLCAGPALADDMTDAHAQQLEQQMRDWLAGLLGPSVDPAARPLHITADGDHYRLEIPFAGPIGTTGATIAGDPVSAKLTPLEGGRWALDDIRLPSPLHVSYPAPGAGKDGADLPRELTTTVDSQDQHAVLDPSLTTGSHWDGTLKGYTSSVAGLVGADHARTRIEDMRFHFAWEPGADGLLNVVHETDSHMLSSTSQTGDDDQATLSIERTHAVVRLDRVAPDQIARIMHAAMRLMPLGVAAARQHAGGDTAALAALLAANRSAEDTDNRAEAADKKAVAEGRMTSETRKKNADARHARAQARMEAIKAARTAAAAPDLSPEDKTAAHEGLLALVDLLGGFDEQGTMENIRFGVAGHSGHLDKLALGLGVGAPEGRTMIRFALGLDGFDSEDIPPGVYRDYVPRHTALALHLGGLPAADLRALLLRAGDSEGNDPELQDEALALLAKGPAVLGLDDLSFDFGPATLRGKGEFRVRAQDDYDGDAHIVATGLDNLIKQANTVPELKQGAPVLLMLKGLGQQEGATTVWDVTYKDGKVLVNGTDLGDMLPGK